MDNPPPTAKSSALKRDIGMKEKAFSITTGQIQSRAISPILIGMLIVVVIFPFIANKLPAVLQSYLNAIHR